MEGATKHVSHLMSFIDHYHGLLYFWPDLATLQLLGKLGNPSTNRVMHVSRQKHEYLTDGSAAFQSSTLTYVLEAPSVKMS